MLDIIFEVTNEEQFKKSKYILLFENPKTDKNFAIIRYKNKGFKFAWSSTLINPKIYFLKDNLFAVGIDLSACIFDFSSGKIIRKMKLDTYFYDFLIEKNYLYLACELEVLIIDLIQFEVVKSIYLPDFFTKMYFEKDYICIECINGIKIVEHNRGNPPSPRHEDL